MDLFEQGAGFSAETLRIAIDVLAATLIMLWGAWDIWKHYELLATKKIKINDFFWASIKVAVLVTFLIVILIIL